MKRTIPLVITAVGGFVLIVASFIPETEDWGEVAAIWFDILASIAFVLGGGSLLKLHLKKISDHAAGWGYSAVTLLAFVVTLYIGLAKTGTQPAPDQEFFGETFASLPLEAFPDSEVASIEGSIPRKANGEQLPHSVREQLSEADLHIVFHGWMDRRQMTDLLEFQDELEWQCRVETLFEDAQPPIAVRGNVLYRADHRALSFRGPMADEQRSALLAMSEDPRWQQAVEQLYEQSRVETAVKVESVPDGFLMPASAESIVSHDPQTGELRAVGPLSVQLRDELARFFPVAKPLVAERRDGFFRELQDRGDPLNAEQQKVFDTALNGAWSAEQLHTVLVDAGLAGSVPKTACEILAEKAAGEKVIQPTRPGGADVVPNDAQRALLERFASEEKMTAAELKSELRSAGPFTAEQAAGLDKFLRKQPTVGERNKSLCMALLRAGWLSSGQRDFFLDPYRTEYAWRAKVGELFVAAHVPKYRWSGSYRAGGSPFWWIYEYLFKPLTASMFAMLAFYVASAAFRAFRAKNFEAMLLLGTAFIILLGRTFAGVMMTSWLPDSLSGLRVENLTVYIMGVFNTAGNRAIMIGIALGIASMSLKVLLGVDRSYLGSRED
jgi:hypothetical protein